MRARRNARGRGVAAIAALGLLVSACGTATTAGEEHYTGPAGRVFPPDAKPVPPSQRNLPADEDVASAAPEPAPAWTVPPAPAARPVSPPPPGEAPRIVAPPPASPTPAPARPPQLASAAPPTPSVIERPIYRAEGEKVGNDIDLRIDRVWLENGFTFAQLLVRNTSPYELEEITIKCTAFGKGHVNLDFREQTLLTRSDGPMRPGFQKSLKIRLERGGLEVREMSCTAKGW